MNQNNETNTNNTGQSKATNSQWENSGSPKDTSSTSSAVQKVIDEASNFAQTAIKEASAAAQAAIKEGTRNQDAKRGQDATGKRKPPNAPRQGQAGSHTRQNVKYTRPDAGHTVLRSNDPNAQKKKSGKKKKGAKKKLDAKTGKATSVFLLIIAIILFLTGAPTMIGSMNMTSPFALNVESWPTMLTGAFYFLGGLVALSSRRVLSKRMGRYKTYYAYINGRDIVPLSDIAMTSGLSAKTVRKDIQKMITDGYFESGTYINHELDSLILCGKTAEELRKATNPFEDILHKSEEVAPNNYMTTLKELRDLNMSIADVTISSKIDKIEELTGKIFRIVEENPDKKNQIRRFESYYLPTTMKLVRSYSTLEKQGVKGENIMAAKENIGRILDTLATGYEQQLDQLFKSDALDIEADINVLENLMAQDGLSDDKSEFRTMTG